MKPSKLFEKKLSRYVDRCPIVDYTSLSEEEKKEDEQNRKTGVAFIDLMYELPEEEALAILDKLEEHDDFISSLENAERELSSSTDDYQENLQRDIDTGWFYEDNDPDDEVLESEFTVFKPL